MSYPSSWKLWCNVCKKLMRFVWRSTGARGEQRCCEGCNRPFTK